MHRGSVKAGNPTGKSELLRIYKALEESAMARPWDREPYAVTSKVKPAGGATNEVPNPKAVRLLRKLDRRCSDLAHWAKTQSDGLYR